MARPPVVLIHGLAGHAGEWAETERRLGSGGTAVAIEVRSHGDVSPAAHVADVVQVLERLGPAAVVGQSLGGNTAMLVAVARPDLVRGLVMVEAGPAPRSEADVAAVERALRQWPVPFASWTDAVAFFGSESWADGLEEREDGWWPRFDVDVMVRTLREAVLHPRWAEWERVRCPVLVVRGEHGELPADEARLMAERARVVDIPGAGHDVHLDQPAAWVAVLGEFLHSLG